MSARTTNAEHSDHVPGPAEIQRIRSLLVEQRDGAGGEDDALFERIQHLLFVALLTPAETVNDMLAVVVCLAEFLDGIDEGGGEEPTPWERDRRKAMENGVSSLAKALVHSGADPMLAGTYPALIGPVADVPAMVVGPARSEGAS